MPRLKELIKPLLFKLTWLPDRLAALNDPVVHAMQELIYLFFAVSVVHHDLWPTFPDIVNKIIGYALLSLASFRLLYLFSPYVLRHTIAFLPTEQKLALIIAHESKSSQRIEELLHDQLQLKAARRVAEVILKMSNVAVRRSIGDN